MSCNAAGNGRRLATHWVCEVLVELSGYISLLPLLFGASPLQVCQLRFHSCQSRHFGVTVSVTDHRESPVRALRGSADVARTDPVSSNPEFHPFMVSVGAVIGIAAAGTALLVGLLVAAALAIRTRRQRAETLTDIESVVDPDDFRALVFRNEGRRASQLGGSIVTQGMRSDHPFLSNARPKRVGVEADLCVEVLRPHPASCAPLAWSAALALIPSAPHRPPLPSAPTSRAPQREGLRGGP